MIDYLALTARCVVGTVLLVSVATKLNSRAGFVAFLDWLRELTVVPERRVLVLGASMVAVETVTLVLLLPQATYLAGLALAAATMAFFAGATMFLVQRGIAVPCHCFGAAASRRSMGPVEFGRDLLLAAIAAFAAVVAVFSPQSTVPVPEIILAVVLGGAIGLVTTRLDDLRQLFAP